MVKGAQNHRDEGRRDEGHWMGKLRMGLFRLAELPGHGPTGTDNEIGMGMSRYHIPTPTSPAFTTEDTAPRLAQKGGVWSIFPPWQASENTLSFQSLQDAGG